MSVVLVDADSSFSDEISETLEPSENNLLETVRVKRDVLPSPSSEKKKDDQSHFEEEEEEPLRRRSSSTTERSEVFESSYLRSTLKTLTQRLNYLFWYTLCEYSPSRYIEQRTVFLNK